MMMEGSSPAFSLTSMKSEAHAAVLNRVTSFARANSYRPRSVVLLHRFFSFHCNTFWIQLFYFVSLCLWGSLALMILKPSNPSFTPRYVDMLFMSTSALTNSGFATINMEDLSNAQIAVLTALMLFGGDVFVSSLGLLLRRAGNEQEAIDSDRMELGSIDPENAVEKSDDSKRCLFYVISGYIALIHVGGSLIILWYVTAVSSARAVLRMKGIDGLLFSISVTVTSFSNGGLIPTNESMMVFRENSGLLLVIVLMILAGNTLFPLFLKLVIWGLWKFTKRVEFERMMEKPREIGFGNLMSKLQATLLSLTVVGFVAIQVVVFCSMDWNLAVFDGLNSYQKIVNALFMAVNTRHAGEGSVDLSIVSPAVLALFIVMMYLPASTSFSLFEEDETSSPKNVGEKKRRRLTSLILPPLCFLVIFVIAICVIESRKLSTDPLNFNIFNVIFEIISAYGNVGLSMGYSCARQLHPIGSCNDKSYGFSGWWSDEGKLILAIVMLYGRLKKFTRENGKAWKV